MNWCRPQTQIHGTNLKGVAYSQIPAIIKVTVLRVNLSKGREIVLMEREKNVVIAQGRFQ